MQKWGSSCSMGAHLHFLKKKNLFSAEDVALLKCASFVPRVGKRELS